MILIESFWHECRENNSPGYYEVNKRYICVITIPVEILYAKQYVLIYAILTVVELERTENSA